MHCNVSLVFHLLTKQYTVETNYINHIIYNKYTRDQISYGKRLFIVFNKKGQYCKYLVNACFVIKLS